MENVVKGPMRGELETVNDGGDLPKHLEGAVSLWCQLRGRVTQS